MGRKRGRSPHPGVSIVKRRHRSGRVAWRGKWVDPDTGKVVYETLSPPKYPNADARRIWAEDKSKKIGKRARDSELGLQEPEEAPVSKAIADYLDARTPELATQSIRNYTSQLKPFAGWAEDSSLQHVQDLTPAMLMRFRTQVVSTEGTKPYTINQWIAATKAALNHWRRLGMLPHINTDHLKDTLRPMRVDKHLPTIIRPRELRKILNATIRHDRDHPTEPLGPLALTILLGGFRLREATDLRWDEIAWEEGAVVLPAKRTKTRTERLVGFDVSPGLRRLLTAMQLRSGGEEGVFALSKDKAWRLASKVIQQYGAPPFEFRAFRRTCAAVLVCGNVFPSGAAVYLAAKRCGHSVLVAERSYWGLMSVDPQAKSIEAALGIEEQARQMIDMIRMASPEERIAL